MHMHYRRKNIISPTHK